MKPHPILLVAQLACVQCARGDISKDQLFETLRLALATIAISSGWRHP